MPKKKEPTYVQDSARDPEDAWIFDSLVGFLRGPVWHVPVMSFIEQKSLIFEPETSSTTHDEAYKKVHEEYKQLVDFMLGSYMEDIGITPQQFQKACGGALGNVKKQFNHNVFEQIWAADDFVVFKRMMIQKNIELQLQALELLQQKYGVLPDSLKPTQKVKSSIKREDSSSEEENDSEQKVMEEVKRKSLAEHQALKGEMDKEKREMEMAIARSVVDHQRLEIEKKSQEDLMEQQMKKLSLTSPTPVLTGIICQKFKKKFLLGGEDSKSSSEDGGEDGLFTATDVIKQEVKRMENRFSDQDLLKLKEAAEAKWKLADQKDKANSLTSVNESFRANTSEPLTESIMTMRSKPGSALIVKQSKDSFSSPLSKKQQESNLEESGSVKSHRKSSQAKIEAPTELALREKRDAILSETEQAHLIPNEQIQKSEEKILSGKLPCEIQQDCAAPSNKSSTSDDKGNSNQINPDELKKRTEFLKAQRDKLLAMKRAEREKQLEDVENSQNVRARPKSAIAARSMMNGESSKIDPQTLKARKALAEKLKAEVIGH